MNTVPKFLFVLTAVAAFSIVYPTSVQAVPTTYRYTGNHFTDVSGPYTTSMFVTAMVTLAAPLGANMPPFTDVTPIAFTFFDGVQTLSSSNPDINLDTFQVGTNAAGQITSWQFDVHAGPITSFNFILSIKSVPPDPHDHDVGGMPPIDDQLAQGVNRGMPGVWSRGIATPDTGSTLSLMTLTLMALGLVARRFQRAAG